MILKIDNGSVLLVNKNNLFYLIWGLIVSVKEINIRRYFLIGLLGCKLMVFKVFLFIISLNCCFSFVLRILLIYDSKFLVY